MAIGPLATTGVALRQALHNDAKSGVWCAAAGGAESIFWIWKAVDNYHIRLRNVVVGF